MKKFKKVTKYDKDVIDAMWVAAFLQIIILTALTPIITRSYEIGQYVLLTTLITVVLSYILTIITIIIICREVYWEEIK